jgi:hypothetical protein
VPNFSNTRSRATHFPLNARPAAASGMPTHGNRNETSARSLAGSDSGHLDLFRGSDDEETIYPAIGSRLAGGAQMSYKTPSAWGYASVSGHGTATFFTAAAEAGYYDVTIKFRPAQSGAALFLTVNGRQVELPAAPNQLTWIATVCVFLPRGITELTVAAPSGALIGHLSMLRGLAQRLADTDTGNVLSSQAEALPRAQRDIALTGSAGSRGSGDNVAFGDDGETLSIPRPVSFRSGEYQLVLRASTAADSATSNVGRLATPWSLDIHEAGAATTRAAVRPNDAWDNRWEKTMPLTLSTNCGSLTLSNPIGRAPDIDTVTLAKFLAGQPSITAA